MKEQFINRYSLSKTLRFSLIPVGKTEENFNAKKLLEEDKKRAEDYCKVKEMIDRYHKRYIEFGLNKVTLDCVNEYADLYRKKDKTDAETEQMTGYEEKMRKQISNALKSDEKYKRLFAKELITEDLPNFSDNNAEKEIVASFNNFTTYFNGFHKNRENMYTHEPKTTAIAYRCINENLPLFLDNIKSFDAVKTALPQSDISALNNDFYNIFAKNVQDIFCTDYFEFVLSQSGIDIYNSFIGGYTCSDKTKIKGLNEYINLYNQKFAKEKSKRLPLIKMLKKQILSDKESVSFIPEKFTSDDELLCAINEYFKTQQDAFKNLSELFSDLKSFDADAIYVKSGIAITNLSNKVFGDWNAFGSAWNKKYELSNPIKAKTNIEKYNEKRENAYKKISSFSLAEMQNTVAENSTEPIADIRDWYSAAVNDAIKNINDNYAQTEDLLNNKYSERYNKKLCKNNAVTDRLKNLLDSVKELEALVKPILGTGKEIKDDLFYGKFAPIFDSISAIDKLYDKVRNYITQKPYSDKKIKLNFENPILLGGWDKNKETDYRSVILRKDGLYYLAIIDKAHKNVFENPPQPNNEDFYEKMEYKLLPGPNKMLPKVIFSAKNKNLFNPPEKILDIRKRESFKKGNNFNIDECHEFIDFFKESIKKYDSWSQFDFNFSPTEKYKDISEFYREVSNGGYQIKFGKISKSYIDELTEAGQIYLFNIYCKDFSKYSHGTQNLHTLYFKMLFDENNLKNVVYKLNGEAEMFYREASINDAEKIIHPSNCPIKNKNPDNPKKESEFAYDLIKDRRYTKRQFSLHIPITINFKASGQEFMNYDVRKAVKVKPDNYIIGIDRGERNLIYICVINSEGKIVEQVSLNDIISDNGHKVDYQKLLDTKQKERDEARKSWNTIENIKELKEGYISQAIHIICELVLKYDAVIAMEDLNFGFKRGRFGVEKQVYQKFENMLISKLNLLIDKKISPESDGGLLKAYQLTNKFDGVNKAKQNGIIFYVPAWDTSKIDPVTGFVNLLRPKYKSVIDSQEFFGKMDYIKYNREKDLFEFCIDYGNFPNCGFDFKKEWTICTFGDRIETFRNPDKNNEWDNKKVNLTEEFKRLFNDFGINYTSDLKQAIISNQNSDFHKRITKLLSLTLQMRNSITGSTLPEDDYLISPVADKNNEFYDSRNFKGANSPMPCDADANGAYNIARKALWAINVLKNTDDEMLDKAKLAITNAQWLEFAQK